MYNKYSWLVLLVLLLIGGLFYFDYQFSQNKLGLNRQPIVETDEESQFNHPLAIEQQRQKSYPGSQIQIEETLNPGINYQQYLASYQSDELRIFGLLTVPMGEKPKNGWPAIVFNHGYIPPDEYQTTERYVAYVDGFAREGFIVFKPDFRGHGNSEGEAGGAYYSDAYITDVLNAFNSLKKYQGVDAKKIGMWGHSMGGNLTLRAMVVADDIKAGVIWAGVVGTYNELMTKWRRKVPWQPPNPQAARHLHSIRQHLQDNYGNPESNPEFWQAIDPRYYLTDISGPVQLHHGVLDESVPWEFSESLRDDLIKADKSVKFYLYENADHNLSSPAFELAMERSVNYFKKHLDTP